MPLPYHEKSGNLINSKKQLKNAKNQCILYLVTLFVYLRHQEITVRFFFPLFFFFGGGGGGGRRGKVNLYKNIHIIVFKHDLEYPNL